MSAVAIHQGGYKPFPDIPEWSASDTVDMSSVDALSSVVQGLDNLPPEVCKKAVGVIRDAAALETGAIEDLYQLDRGITITAATEGALLEHALNAQDEQVRALIESQLRAYEYVLDFVTKKQPLAEAWIRDLHIQLCGSQKFHKVRTSLGAQEERPLRHGEYKSESNYVLSYSGKKHVYASVQEIGPEMRRLIESLQSEACAKLHPVDQIAYAHFAFVAIHPFSDGNGRMARAIASVFAYRNYRVPLLITADQKRGYFAALESADESEFGPFRRFIRDRVADSILLLAESVRGAQLGTPADGIRRVREVFETRGGYSHVEIDHAGFGVLEQLEAHLKKEVEQAELKIAGLGWSVSMVAANRNSPDAEKYRAPISASNLMIHLRAQTLTPADAIADLFIAVVVPRNAADTDNFLIECGAGQPELSLFIPVRSLLPNSALATDIAVKMYAKRIVTALATDVASLAQQSLRKKGY